MRVKLQNSFKIIANRNYWWLSPVKISNHNCSHDCWITSILVSLCKFMTYKCLPALWKKIPISEGLITLWYNCWVVRSLVPTPQSKAGVKSNLHFDHRVNHCHHSGGRANHCTDYCNCSCHWGFKCIKLYYSRSWNSSISVLWHFDVFSMGNNSNILGVAQWLAITPWKWSATKLYPNWSLK